MGRVRMGFLCLCWCCVFPTALSQLVNVATGKTYNQSSTYVYNSISNPSSYAANGDTEGDYFSSNCIHTAGDDFTPWWQVDLGRKFPVYDVTLWARKNFIDRLYPLNITVDGQLCVRAYSNNDRKQSLTCTLAIYGQLVRLTRDYEDTGLDISLNLCEVQIWVCPDGYYGDQCNLTCSSKTSRCSQCDPDGNCVACSGRLKLPQCTGCDTGYYKSGTDCVECSNTCRNSQCDSDSGRCHVNVATGKTYNQSSTYVYNSISNPSSYAANGDTEGDYFSSNCIHTAGDDFPPWWQVDLGRKFPVYDVTLWARKNFIDRLYPLNITVDGQLCVRAYSNNDRKQSLTCTSAIYGQLVRLTRDYVDTDLDISLNLCEVQIWVCPDGYYGDRCNLTCSSKTSRCSHCDPDGNCVACSGRLKLPQCTGCDTGYYKSGTDCVECSNTCRNSQCDSDSGRCHVNVATGKTYNQSSTFVYNSISNPSSYAANGDTEGDYFSSNCIHTAGNDFTPWWQVDLGRKFPVYDVTLWARKNFIDRLYPLNITVDGQLCVRAYSNNDRKQSLTCTSAIYGQLVRLTRDYVDTGLDISLNLCEVQIWVCPDGYYGDQCNLTCSSKTSRCSQCDPDGNCVACSGRLKLPQCTGCDTGYYESGTDCVECSNTCRNSQCDSDSGRCHVCASDRQWGKRCEKSCSHCATYSCDRHTGKCNGTGGENGSLVGPVVGSVLGAGLMTTIGVTAAIWYWRRKSSTNAGKRTSTEMFSSALASDLRASATTGSNPSARPCPGVCRTVDEDGYCIPVGDNVYEIAETDGDTSNGHTQLAAPPSGSAAAGVKEPDYRHLPDSGHAAPSSSCTAADESGDCENYDRLCPYSNEDDDGGLYNEIADVTAGT